MRRAGVYPVMAFIQNINDGLKGKLPAADPVRHAREHGEDVGPQFQDASMWCIHDDAIDRAAALPAVGVP